MPAGRSLPARDGRTGGLTNPTEDHVHKPSTLIRSRLATHVRYRPDDTQAADELRRDYRAARLEEYIARTLAAAPPLTDEQRQRLALLLQSPPASRVDNSGGAPA